MFVAPIRSPCNLSYLVRRALVIRPFPPSSVHHAAYLTLRGDRSYNGWERMAVFLVRRGYGGLSESIGARLQFEWLPSSTVRRLEEAQLEYAVEQSDATFMDDTDARERPASPRQRSRSVDEQFPFVFANDAQRCLTPSCAICQEPIKRRQHIRILHGNCAFHKRCIDRWFEIRRSCPVCRVACVE